MLLNRKKIWAIFFLCFSLPRNFMILFYDTEKSRKVSFMRHLKVFGFFWVAMSSTLQVALLTYPMNYSDFPKLTTGWVGTIMSSGVIYGYGVIYFYLGFQIMNDRLVSMYRKSQQFNMVLFIFKNFLYYTIPICYITVVTIFIMPFIGDGPIFPKVMDDFFLQSCNTYWWTNVLLISNFVPWTTDQMCLAHISLISNEFQMIIVLIPLFGYIYNKYHRQVLTVMFFLIGVGASLIPVVQMTLKYNVDGFPGFLSNSYSDMYTKVYFRIPSFLMGIALGIFHFEYRHVTILRDGSKPFHRDYIQMLIKKYPRTFNFICYFFGMLLVVGSIGALVYNSSCITKVDMSTVFLKKTDIQYCWSPVGSAIYYAVSPIFFYLGLTIVLLPCLIGISSILKPLMNSHLWHIMEELTFQAYLIQYLVVIWFFASREQNTLLSAGYLLQITVSSWMLSYLIAIPFYMIVERPFKNFLDLILFPKSSIFKK